MQREIKFRAWDKEQKRMYGADHVNDLREWREKPNILMQFTGLKDKNGKEIYEGDILRGDVCDDGDEEIMSVGYKDGAFCFGYYTRANYPSLEIIGNIYENSDLLK